MTLPPTVSSRNALQCPHPHEAVPKSEMLSSTTQQPPLKKAARRSSKPIINWIQRKLGGTVKSKKISEGTPLQSVGRGKDSSHTGVAGCSAESRPAPSSSSSPQGCDTNVKQQTSLDAADRKLVSVNGDEAKDNSVLVHDGDEGSMDSTSLALESTWSPASALEADEDASVRPLPPSAPPSPSPSRSSSSYLSDPRTFRSIAASTKPTTVLSVDLTPNGLAHIAQVPATPISPVAWFPPHVRTASTTTNPPVASGTSVTFSALPPSPQSSRPSSMRIPVLISSTSQPNTAHVSSPISSVQAPLHTTHHPRNNPRPSSPPLDNASMLTLASSAFAFSGSRGIMPGWSSAPASATGGGDSLSQFGGSLNGGGYADAESTSQFVLGDDERLDERDVAASVRALRPRSSRRGSWDSEASDWSAGVQGMGTPSFARERSVRTTNSTRTGGQISAEDMKEPSDEPIGNGRQSPPEDQTTASPPPTEDTGHPNLSASLPETETTPRKAGVVEPNIPAATVEQCAETTDSVVLTTDSSPVCEDQPRKSPGLQLELDEAVDRQSMTSPDSLKDIWHSAPSTPVQV